MLATRLAVLFTCNFASAQRTSWIVDQAGGGHFTDIQSAISIARPGDHVVVRGAFTYQPFFIVRGVDVEATQGATVPHLAIANLPAGEHAAVRGFRVTEGLVAAWGGRIAITGCRGTVHVSSLQIASTTPFSSSGTTSVAIADCDAVLLTDVAASFPAERSYGAGPLDGVALSVRNSAVHVQRCVLRGQRGRNAGGILSPSNEGAAGAVLQNSRVVFAATTLSGGGGGNGALSGAHCEENGGDALNGDGGVVMARCVLTGGPPGQPGGRICAPPRAGYAAAGRLTITADCTTTGGLAQGAVLIPALASLSSPGHLTQGQPTTLTARAAPGTVLLLVFDDRHGHLPVPGSIMPLLVGVQFQSLALVGVGAAGSAPVTFTLPIDAYRRDTFIYFQGAALTPNGAITLTDLGDFRMQ